MQSHPYILTFGKHSILKMTKSPIWKGTSYQRHKRPRIFVWSILFLFPQLRKKKSNKTIENKIQQIKPNTMRHVVSFAFNLCCIFPLLLVESLQLTDSQHNFLFRNWVTAELGKRNVWLKIFHFTPMWQMDFRASLVKWFIFMQMILLCLLTAFIAHKQVVKSS